MPLYTYGKIYSERVRYVLKYSRQYNTDIRVYVSVHRPVVQLLQIQEVQPLSTFPCSIFKNHNHFYFIARYFVGFRTP